jgi:hypothetical protein
MSKLVPLLVIETAHGEGMGEVITADTRWSLSDAIHRNMNATEMVSTWFPSSGEEYGRLTACAYHGEYFFGLYKDGSIHFTGMNGDLKGEYSRIFELLAKRLVNFIAGKGKLETASRKLEQAWLGTRSLLDCVIARTEEFNSMYRDANGNVKDVAHGPGAWTEYLNDIRHLVAEYEAVQEIRQYYKQNGIPADITNDWNGGVYINGSLAAVLGEDHVWQYSDTLPEDMELPEVEPAGNPELEREEALFMEERDDLVGLKDDFLAAYPGYSDTVLYVCETEDGDIAIVDMDRNVLLYYDEEQDAFRTPEERMDGPSRDDDGIGLGD